MNDIRDILEREDIWEEVYDKMIMKQGISAEDINDLWVLKEIDKKEVIEQIVNGEIEWSVPRKVRIAKSSSKKKRVVYIYTIKERMILSVLYKALNIMLVDKFSANCFSYRKDIGTLNAINYIKENKSEDFRYGVKVDIHAYFNSVSKERVREVIDEYFEGGIKDTLEKLIFDNRVNDRGIIKKEWKSLIPGCAIGSLLANLCLLPCDNYFLNKDCIYARYSDDIILIEKTEEDLNKDLSFIKEKIAEYGLEINKDKYKWFTPNDEVEFLGLKLRHDGVIDISDHAKKKIKKQIHRWCRKGRMSIERDGADFTRVARKVIRQFNNKNMFCIIDNNVKFGWATYAFSKITTTESLREIDYYFRDTLRAMKTGRHNKGNVKYIDDKEFKELGYLSLVEMYRLFKEDYDYYMEIVELNKHLGSN